MTWEELTSPTEQQESTVKQPIEQVVVKQHDIEMTPSRPDPLALRQFKKSTEELSSLSSPVRDFYRHQNSMIEMFLSLPGKTDEQTERNLAKLQIAIYGSFAANVILFGLQLTAAIISNSLALFATAAGT